MSLKLQPPRAESSTDLPRVLLATTFEFPHTGGASTHMEALIAQLRQLGQYGGVYSSVQFAPPKWQRRLLFLSRACRRTWYAMALNDWMVSRLAYSLEQALSRDPSIQIIHAHDHRACLAARAAANRRQAAGAPAPRVVQTVHGPWLFETRQTGAAPEGSRYSRHLTEREAASFKAADAIIAVDTGQKQIALDFGADPARTCVVFNAVDLDDIDRCASGPCPLDVPPPFFVVPRRLVQKTGVRYAIEAVARIPELQRPRLIVAGQGLLHAELDALVRQLNLTAWVQLVGPIPRPQLIPLMTRAAGVIVPSVPAGGVVEATSLSVIEAMALRVPVIASAIGGLAEIIEPDRTGLLVPPADPDALASAMQRVLRNDVSPTMRDDARRFVEERLSTRPWFEAIGRVYREVCAVGAPETGLRQP